MGKTLIFLINKMNDPVSCLWGQRDTVRYKTLEMERGCSREETWLANTYPVGSPELYIAELNIWKLGHVVANHWL